VSAEEPEPVPGSDSTRFRRLTIDLTPLRTSRDFRLLWSGLLVSVLGHQLAIVAVFVQVTQLTGSAAAVGVTGLVGVASLAAGSLLGASVLDRWDRRRLLIVAQVGDMGGSALLLAGAVAGRPPLVVIYVGVALEAAFSSIDAPTRSAIAPRLVGHELIPSVQALNQILWNGSALLGPALGGILVANAGVGWVYAIDLVTYVVMLVVALRIRPVPPETGDHVQTGWSAIKEGFAYVRSSRLLQSTFAIDLVAMIFGMPRALFTFLAVSQFHRGPEVVGLLFAAPAVGAVLGALTSGWTRRVRRQGDAVLLAVVGWGLAIAAFGLVRNLTAALVLLAVAGWADLISAIFRGTILQLSVPDRLRGRMSGIHLLVVAGGPRLGDFEAGFVAQAVNPTFSVVTGGLACVLGAAVVTAAYPALRRYRMPGPPSDRVRE
jgi:MFS family permease